MCVCYTSAINNVMYSCRVGYSREVQRDPQLINGVGDSSD